ncbi:hypothetical protein [Phocaeicola sp.]
MNTQSVLLHYQIAGHPFDLVIPPDILVSTIQESYKPFQVEPTDSPPLFTLTVAEDGTLFPPIVGTISSFEKGYGTITMYYTSNQGVIIHLSLPDQPPCCYVYADVSNKNILVCLHGTPEEMSYGLNNSIMLAYTFATIRLDTVLINASVVEHQGRGYLFPGRNGMAGIRRTHCQLWREYIEDCTLLNNDTTVIRIVEGKPFLYSTPWNEHEICLSNTSVPLKAIVQLARAQHRQITSLSKPGIYATLLSACWSLKWNDGMIGVMHNIIWVLTENIGTYRLECTSDIADVELCAQKLGVRRPEPITENNY